jgi:hypothetical protein
MGWCSGTSVFDDVAGFVLSTNKGDDEKYTLLVKVAAALEQEDWDCQSDSSYYYNAIVMRVWRKLHPDWFEDEE